MFDIIGDYGKLRDPYDGEFAVRNMGLNHESVGAKKASSQSPTESYWLKSERRRYPKLSQALDVDVAIIGGGVTGLSMAYLCKQQGQRVAVFERGLLGAVDSGHTSAHLTYVTDLRLSELEKKFGIEHAVAVWDAGKAALEQIHEIIHDASIECDFSWVSGFLHQGGGDEGSEAFKAEAELAEFHGFDLLFREHVPVFNDSGIEFFHQAKFHPLRYLQGLAQVIEGDGSYVFERSEASEFTDKPLSFLANGHGVTCKKIAFATHTPLQGTHSLIGATLLQSKLYLYTSYVIRALLSDRHREASFWDTADPYQYLRIDQERDACFAILGGEDRKTGKDLSPEERFQVLENRLWEILPTKKITQRWLGQVIETPDGLPYIGEVSENCFVATGFAGNGFTFGTLAGMMFGDLVSGRKNPWKTLFSPSRKSLSGTWNYLRENKDYPYYFLKDRLQREREIPLESLNSGEGKLLRHNGRSVAAYRDAGGKLSLLSPSCTHLGCYVRWNSADSMWECPCHGSRFHPTGEVQAGPAEAPLQKLAADKQ